MNPNPLFIPVHFQEIKDGKVTLYCTKQVAGKNIRVIEYYNQEGLLDLVNVWGICGDRLEYMTTNESGTEDDRFVAHDRMLDRETMKAITGPFAEMYPKPARVTFFNTQI